jgi:hypothetical protein
MFDLEDFPVGSWVITKSNRRGQVIKHLHWQRGIHRHDIRVDRALVRYEDDGDTVRIMPELLTPTPPPFTLPARGQLVFDFA